MSARRVFLELIITDEARTGTGTEASPVRVLYRIFTADGVYLCDIDGLLVATSIRNLLTYGTVDGPVQPVRGPS